MKEDLADLGGRFFFSRGTLVRLTEGLGEDDWARRPSDQGGNTIHWIVGHVAASRRLLLRKLGVEIPEEGWEAHFGMHAKPGGTETYPSPAELIRDVTESGKALTRRLEEMSAAEAGAPWGSTLPDGNSSVGGGAHFYYFHEVYHVGQLALLRRMCGVAGIA